MTSSIHSPALYQSFVAKPYTPNIGATLHGLDLSQPLSDLAQTELKAALARFEVIFFRDQVLTPAQQVAALRLICLPPRIAAPAPLLLRCCTRRCNNAKTNPN